MYILIGLGTFFFSTPIAAISDVVRGITQASSIKYNNLVYELTEQGRSIITLSMGEASFDIPAFSFDALSLNGQEYWYSHSRGLASLREKLSVWYQNERGICVDPKSEIIITSGAKPAIYFSLISVLDRGDEAIIFEPSWVSYVDHIRLCHANYKAIPCTKTVFEVAEYISDKTKVIILNNPQNPSGKVYTRQELAFLVSLAQEKGLYILADESYSDYVGDIPFYSILEFDPEKKHVIVCNSVSKNVGMSGFRIGYVITHADLMEHILKLNQHILTCPSTIAQYYVEYYFEKILSIVRPQIKEIIKKREAVCRMLDQLGFEVMPGTGTFYLFVSIYPTRLSSEEFCMKLLTEKGISTTPGMSYGESCNHYIRISISTEPLETIYSALVEIKNLIKETEI